MPKEEREHLLQEIEEIRNSIDRIQPELHYQLSLTGSAESSRATLASLRKALARDMELLHAAG